jgi:hypothetical protein
MIQLTKLEEPQLLADGKEVWKQDLLSYYNLINDKYTVITGLKIPATVKNRYNDEQIKEQLKRETFEKCVYCESKMLHISFADIEHILPKSIRPDLAFNWMNLTLACEKCNRTAKNDYYDEAIPLLNPYIENPSEHLVPFGAMIMARGGSERGYITKTVIKLNRTELVQNRAEKIELLEPLVLAWSRMSEGLAKDFVRNKLLEYIAIDKEYSFIIRGYLELNNVINRGEAVTSS